MKDDSKKKSFFKKEPKVFKEEPKVFKEEAKVFKEDPKVFKNNSAFRRAMSQMKAKTGDKITVSFDDGATYIVECI